MNLNSSARLDNQCVLTTTGRVENSSLNSVNSGLLRVGGSAGSAGAGGEVFNNNARYTQTSTGITIGLDLSNNNTVTGFGQYLFAGRTQTQNTFVGDSLASPIVLDDRTRTGPVSTRRTAASPTSSPGTSTIPATPRSTRAARTWSAQRPRTSSPPRPDPPRSPPGAP